MRRLAFIRTITHDLATKPVQISTIYGNLPNIPDLVLKQSNRQPRTTSAKDYDMYLCYCMVTMALKHMNDEMVELTEH